MISNLWFPLWAWGSPPVSLGMAPGVVDVTRVVLAQSIKTAMMLSGSSSGNGTVQVVVYADTATGPGALISSIPMTFTATNQFKTVALSLVAGAYWIGLQNVGAGQINMFCVTLPNPFLPGTDAPVSQTTTYSAWSAAGQGATVPNPFPMGAVARNYSAIATWLQAA